MQDLGEESVEHEEHSPVVSVMLHVESLLQVYVPVQHEGYVLDHHKKIGHRQRRQNIVRRPSHVLRGQHANIKDIRHRTENTHDQAQVTVDPAVLFVKKRQVAISVIRTVLHFRTYVKVFLYPTTALHMLQD